jgi:hypothetical protein
MDENGNAKVKGSTFSARCTGRSRVERAEFKCEGATSASSGLSIQRDLQHHGDGPGRTIKTQDGDNDRCKGDPGGKNVRIPKLSGNFRHS